MSTLKTIHVNGIMSKLCSVQVYKFCVIPVVESCAGV